MRECFTYGSVRGAAGNGCPYRDPRSPAPESVEAAQKRLNLIAAVKSKLEEVDERLRALTGQPAMNRGEGSRPNR